MNKPKSLFIILTLLITITGFTSVYASHGSNASGGGGSCGNCIPPTLGVDEIGKTRVNGGISINGIPFDVELYSQSIPVQILNKGEISTITLKIFDDTGADSVAHVELHFEPYEKVINGILVEHSISHLVWHNEYGDETIGIYDNDQILQNIKIDAKNIEGFKIISFEFEPTIIMDETTLMTRVWDDRKNVVNNYFTNAIKVISENNSKLTQTDEIQTDEIQTDEIQTDEIQTDEIQTDEIQTDEIQTDEIQTIIPAWIKDSTGWWAEGKIGNDTFLKAVEYMIEEDIINVQVEHNEKNNNEENTIIPNWIKETSKWWSDDLISDDDFVKNLQFLISNKIIST